MEGVFSTLKVSGKVKLFNKNKTSIRASDFERISYSQEGEDILISRILGTDYVKSTKGFYIDIGAHHPFRVSNTYYFYKLGWRGINVDATPGSMELFKSKRPEDINIEALIGSSEEPVNFYQFNWTELNTFSEEIKDKFLANPEVRLTATLKLETRTLKEIFQANVRAGQKIDFMTVDVEGKDLEVLQTNDWDVYRPTLVLAEDLFQRIEGTIQSPLNKFMASKGYILVCKTYNSTFFVEQNYRFDSF